MWLMLEKASITNYIYVILIQILISITHSRFSYRLDLCRSANIPIGIIFMLTNPLWISNNNMGKNIFLICCVVIHATHPSNFTRDKLLPKTFRNHLTFVDHCNILFYRLSIKSGVCIQR